ncbi:MAG: hypothetical protein JJU12_04920 [Chlamydiales bacterium]|nr:hypothetical protein [Chlamydiales bacterium]
MLKILHDLTLLLPLRRRRIFFIYTHNNAHDRFTNGLTANTEISYWCHCALKKAGAPVTFLRLQGEKPWRVNQITAKDIVIGHPGETYRKACTRTNNVIAFQPWSGDEDRNQSGKTNCTPLEIELEDYARAKSIIWLTSEFNVKKYLQTKTNFWFDYYRNKPIRLIHQPIDLQQFPRIKTDYHTNNFLYIGNDLHMKCLDDSRRLVKELDRTLTVYGVGGKKLNNLDSPSVKKLAQEADFFIQPGMWEAQCVSILEAAARGFIPVVSPETGYPYEHPFLLKHGDHAYNLKTLQALLKTPPGERKALADHLHKKLVSDINHNNWKGLTDVLLEEVKKLIS